MKPDEIDHIRADVRQAILEAAQHDPPVTLEILWRLFDRVAMLAEYDIEQGPIPIEFDGRFIPTGSAIWWASDLLRDVQVRAISKVPYGEAQDDDEPPRDPEDRL